MLFKEIFFVEENVIIMQWKLTFLMVFLSKAL